MKLHLGYIYLKENEFKSVYYLIIKINERKIGKKEVTEEEIFSFQY